MLGRTAYSSRNDSAHLSLVIAQTQFLENSDVGSMESAVRRAYPRLSGEAFERVLASWTSADRKRLIDLSAYKDSRIHLGLVHNPNTPEAALANIIESSDSPIMRSQALRHQNAPHDKLVIAVKRGTPIEAGEAASHTRIGRSDLDGVRREGYIEDALALRAARRLVEAQ